MRLREFQALKVWYGQHGCNPVERNVWDGVLTIWVLGWIGAPTAFILKISISGLQPTKQSKRLAPRLKTIRGARIGILDNCKEFADVVLTGVVDVLQRDYGVEIVKLWQKRYLGIPSPYAQEMAAECDAVINGVGH